MASILIRPLGWTKHIQIVLVASKLSQFFYFWVYCQQFEEEILQISDPWKTPVSFDGSQKHWGLLKSARIWPSWNYFSEKDNIALAITGLTLRIAEVHAFWSSLTAGLSICIQGCSESARIKIYINSLILMDWCPFICVECLFRMSVFCFLIRSWLYYPSIDIY